MDINATLLGQMLVFGVLIWFSWKFIWPPLTKAVEDRQKKIAEGLAAAERGQTELQSAHGEAQGIISAARDQAKKIVDQAHKREVEIVDEARSTAAEEGKRIVDSSRQDAAQEFKVGAAPHVGGEPAAGLVDETDAVGAWRFEGA